ncbi:FprA family A-type flavoprotein [bacterium]|nr:FprA family A-type flavoprotein [bacterium]
MPLGKIKENIWYVGAIDWDRRLFDSLIPLPEGTSYNAYLIKGNEKTALIDTVDPSKEDELFKNLEKLNVEKIDYLIANHAEQDHSGSIPAVLNRFPMAKVISTPKAKDILKDLLLLEDEVFLTVGDGESVSLGDKNLKFIHAPWVHWPDTMLTYLVEDKILFPCDLFGSHLATSDLFAVKKDEVHLSAKRYYAEIMMPFRNLIKGHLEKVRMLELDMIAPSHGPIYAEPDFIIKVYEDWVSDEVKDEVVVAHISMHGSTEAMTKFLVDKLIEKGIGVKVFELTNSDIGALAMALVDPATLVLATPTVLGSPHPNAIYAAYLVSALRPKLKYVGLIGSYSWGGKTAEKIKEILSNLKVEFLPPVLAKGYPKEEDFQSLERLAEEITIRHKGLKGG